MKHIRITLAALCLFATVAAPALDPKSILSGLTSSSSSSSSTTSSDKSSTLSNIVSTVSSLVGGSDMSYSNMVGTWKYSSPAVAFESDNLLQKAGGAAASTTIQNKLKSYYKTAGITSMTITFGSDNSFTAKIGKLSPQGTVEDLGNGKYRFNFKAFGTVSSGKLDATVQKTVTGMQITFDATKLLSLVSKISSVAGSNSQLSTLSSLLSSYDGLQIGVELKKSK